MDCKKWSDRIIFRSSLKLAGMVTLCDNADDKAVLMPIQREAVEKGLQQAEEEKTKKSKKTTKGAKAAKAVDIEE